MKYPVPLAKMWMKRLSDDPRWWADAYEKAVERIEDHTDAEDPYWYSPADESDALSDGSVNGQLGDRETPEQTRARAFELLALADLAEYGEVARHA